MLRQPPRANHLAPGAESSVSGSTVLVGGQAMAAELEVVVDGQEALGMAGVSFRRGPRMLARFINGLIRVPFRQSACWPHLIGWQYAQERP